MEIIECWKHGVKITPNTKCNHWKDDKGNPKKCGDVPACFYKTNVAKYQYIKAQSYTKEEIEEMENHEQPKKPKIPYDASFY